MLSDAGVFTLYGLTLVSIGGMLTALIVTWKRSIRPPLAPEIMLSELLVLKQLARRVDPAFDGVDSYRKWFREQMVGDALGDIEQRVIDETLSIIDWFPKLVDEISRLHGIDPKILK